MGLGVAVTIQAPTHAQGLDLMHLDHLVDAAVTVDATNTCTHVDAVIKVRVFREHVDLDPRDRNVGAVAFANNCQQWAVLFDLGMATHAGLCGGDSGVRRLLDGVVAVAAVHAQLASMQLVAEGHGLLGHVAYVGVLWRKIVPDKANNTGQKNRCSCGNGKGNAVGPLREYHSHGVRFLTQQVVQSQRLFSGRPIKTEITPGKVMTWALPSKIRNDGRSR